MRKSVKAKAERNARVRRGIRSKITGTAVRPRLAVHRSINHIYAQLIDDEKGATLAEASSLTKELKVDEKDGSKKMSVGSAVGRLLAQRAKEKGIEKVVFDRGTHRYHGQIKALADGARKNGLIF